jgi:hypothetical protein
MLLKVEEYNPKYDFTQEMKQHLKKCDIYSIISYSLDMLNHIWILLH